MNPNDTISEILNHKGTNAWVISPDATVFDAVQLMSDKNVGALLVTEGAKLVGIISERDYTRKVVLKGKSSKGTAVRESCPATSFTCRRQTAWRTACGS